MAKDRRGFLAGLGITTGGAALCITNVPLVGLAAAQDTPKGGIPGTPHGLDKEKAMAEVQPTTEAKPFLHIQTFRRNFRNICAH
jgi:hypothetical protein